MKTIFKIIVTTIIAFLILVVFLNLIFVLSPTNKNSVQHDLNKYSKEFTITSQYIEKYYVGSARFDSDDDKINGYTINEFSERLDGDEIEKQVFIDAITTIFFDCGYEMIILDGNELYFQKWSNKDYGRGIVHSTDGTTPDSELLVELEPLENFHWYFYIEE